MTRLIDADELRKEIDKLDTYWLTRNDGKYMYGSDVVEKIALLTIIDNTPEIDAVKIIRCINCDNYAPTESGKLGYCCVNDGIWFANDFCIHGRPRESD